MERAEITTPGGPLAVRQYPMPTAPPKGLLIKTLCAGICHTDLHLINDAVPLGEGKFWRHRDVLGDKFAGVVPGHEIVGSIMALGSDVPADSGLKVGETVLIYPWRGCRNCSMCGKDYNNMCLDNKGTTTDIGKGLNQGGYSSHIPVPDWQLALKCPSNVSMEVACMLPCSAVTTYSALEKIKESLERGVEARGEARVLIVGAGGLGLWAVILCKRLYKDLNVKVICADISDDRLEMSRGVGADEGLVWPIEASEEDLIEITNKSGKMDAVLDIVGAPKTFRSSFYSLNTGGTLVPIGLAGGSCAVPLPHLIGRSIAIRASRTGSPGQVNKLVALIEKEGIPNMPPVEIFELKQANEALDKLRARQIKGRAVFKF